MNTIMALLPVIAFLLLFCIVQRYEKCWRSSVLTASVICGAVVIGITEGLSGLHELTPLGTCLTWGFVNLVLGGLFLQLKAWRSCRSTNPFRHLEAEQTFLLLGIIGIILVVGLISLVAPPNNWDSMAYVMARVAHWEQNQTIAHFPTHYPPQLYNGPWAEFVILQFQLLTGADHLANLLHWLSFAGSLVGVSLITKQLKGNLQAQLFSVVFCATIPVGILHASTPKNTYVVTFWLVCFAYYGLTILKNRMTWRLTLLLSASLGLAVLTKGSAYIYTLPGITALLIIQFYRFKTTVFKHVFLSMFVVLTLNLGHYLRNSYVFGSPTSTYPYKWSNDIYSLPVFASNIIRNISLHLTFPFLFDSQIVDRFVIWLHELIVVNPVDKRTTLDVVSMTRPEDFTVNGSPLFEDLAGNPLHFWLIIIVIISIFFQHRFRKNRYLIGYLIVVISSFFLFCFLLKWQPWHSRLHLPIFVWLSSIAGIRLSMIRHQKITQCAILALLLSSVPYLFFNDLRPIVGQPNIFTSDRVTQYFAARSPLLADYRQITQLIKAQSCQNIGLIITPGSWEYPLWILLETNDQNPLRIEHVAVENKTGIIAQDPKYKNFIPCSIVVIGNYQIPDPLIAQNQKYQIYWKSIGSREKIQLFRLDVEENRN